MAESKYIRTRTPGGSEIWEVNTALQGEKGDKGDKGDTGDTGATGATGAQGPQGDPGILNVSSGTGTPSGGSDGDIYFQYSA